MTGVRSPSKHSSVEYLESIKADNYLGKAKEYASDEVDSLIWQKRQAKVDKIDFSDTPDAPRRAKAKPRKRPAPRVRNLAPNPSLEEMPTYLCMSSWSVSGVFLYLSACASIGLAFGALF